MHPLENLKALHLDIIHVALNSVEFCRLDGGNSYLYALFCIIIFLPVNGTCFSEV